MNTVLVTGGAGYIGLHTIVELHKNGYDIVILDNFSNSYPEDLSGLKKIIGYIPDYYSIDLSNKDDLMEIFDKYSFIGVIHLAGLKSVNESTQLPLKYYHNNIISTINLLEVMTIYNVKNLVFSSSATVYSRNVKMPVTEDDNLEANNPYGRTKLIIEEMLKDLYNARQEWSIVSLRYFNPIGAHESGLIGENSVGIPNNLLPYITKVATGELDKLNVFGGDYETKDGTGVRDFVHVTDLAKGHVKAINKFNQKGMYCYNLGTGKGYSVLDVIKIFKEISKRDIPYKITKRRPGDIAIIYASVAKAFKELNWKAEKNLYDMCRDNWNYQMISKNFEKKETN